VRTSLLLLGSVIVMRVGHVSVVVLDRLVRVLMRML
jgi:hypothetical protein